jgi:nucleoside 2-deoxyribosyltransferase
MKIYCAHSSGFDYNAEYYQPLSRLSELYGHELILPHANPDIMRNSKESIRSCDMMVAEVSYPSTGMGIEMSWAESFGIPILALYRASTKPSDSIKAITRHVHPYITMQDMIDMVSSFKDIKKKTS